MLEGGSVSSFSQQTRLGKNIELADLQVAKASDFYNNFDVSLVCRTEQKDGKVHTEQLSCWLLLDIFY